MGVRKLTEKIWKHDELAEDLAIAKGGIPFLNVCLGSAWLNRRVKTPRADLVVCRPSYKKFCVSVFEIKVSRADFLSDIRSDKWRDYLPHCDRFYFAVCKGVLELSDIPPEAGLVVRGPNGWHTRKTAPKMEHEIPMATMKSLVFAKQRMSVREKRLDDIRDIYRDFRKDYFGRLKAARIMGKQFGDLYEAAMRVGGLKKALALLNGEIDRDRKLG
jgi:hypothetical protein